VFTPENPATYTDYHDLFCSAFRFLNNCPLYEPIRNTERLESLIKHFENMSNVDEEEKAQTLNELRHALTLILSKFDLHKFLDDIDSKMIKEN